MFTFDMLKCLWLSNGVSQRKKLRIPMKIDEMAGKTKSVKIYVHLMELCTSILVNGHWRWTEILILKNLGLLFGLLGFWKVLSTGNEPYFMDLLSKVGKTSGNMFIIELEVRFFSIFGFLFLGHMSMSLLHFVHAYLFSHYNIYIQVSIDIFHVLKRYFLEKFILSTIKRKFVLGIRFVRRR